ncbi:MAG: D-glycero-beta-D-manno-heptose 1-phosphate adenylyltransferase, partial [Deltaproteobacteria bacterium]|nr:D-glycero-beta-D-manno-heptose 1-phosphate adenylyltransferase [Deltaproteobacteria bacterium]
MAREESSVLTVDELEARLAECRRQGKKIVFTNGCFDILHPGHVTYLEAARGLGDTLVVGLNSDLSVQRLKGEKRPIMPQSARARLLTALEAVSFVVIFDEETPYDLIARLKPDILVKGGDWKPETIVGRDLVEARGGKVCALPFVGDYSTSAIIEEIIRRYDRQ